MSSTSSAVDPILPIVHRPQCTAINERRLIDFTYQGRRRIAEPHDYGITGGRVTLFFHQVGGESRSGEPFGWRRAHVPDMTGLRLLDRHFRGPRPVPSNRHIRWDVLFASVSQAERSRGE